jgi:AraC-like DNA-binding protein
VAGTSAGAISDRSSLTHYPDAAAVLVFRTTAGGRSDLTVMGPRTRASYYAGKDIPVCVRVRIRPGCARPLLGVEVSELVDRVVPLSSLWGSSAGRLVDSLAGLDAGPVLERISLALRERLALVSAAEVSRASLLSSATSDLAARVSVPGVASRHGVSERQLRNLFHSGVGVSPRGFARIERVRTVIAGTRDQGLASVASGAGYYDQSHMTAEFRELMGVPPGAFVAGRLPAVQPC